VATTEKLKSLIALMVTLLIATSCVRHQKPAIEWASIPAGTFTMGSPTTEVDRFDIETQHQVTLSAFKMSKQEITVAQFKAFVDATGYVTDADKGTLFSGSYISIYENKAGVNWKCDVNGNPRPVTEYKHPVIHVSWNDAKAFADWMGCRLPTEAEWEYACRARTKTPFNTWSNLATAEANYNGNYPYNNHPSGQYREKTMPVGSFAPNVWGLYDMHGNVWEWCSIGMVSIPPGPKPILKAFQPGRTACSAVAAGATMRRVAGRRSASATIQINAPAVKVSAWSPLSKQWLIHPSFLASNNNTACGARIF